MAKSKKFLTRDEILEIDDLPTKEVWVPYWKAYVKVRILNAGERDAFEASLYDKDGNMRLEGMRARLVSLVCVDEAGERLFTEADAELLNKKSAAAIDLIVDEAKSLNRMLKEDFEELEKN